ncbi:helix-turn-helix transcriptional regulator [Nocardiopsis coralliicola]
MADPSARMLDLLSLLQDGRLWPAAELARRTGAPPRTLRRDLDRLRGLGYPVESVRGPVGGYRLVAGRALPPLHFTDDEAVAAAIGLRFAATARFSDVDGVAAAALAKLERLLPSRLRQRVRSLSASVETAGRPGAGPELGTLAALGDAIAHRQHIRFTYTDRAGLSSERRVEPATQVLLGRRWYLLAWDRDREDWRTFRIDRVAGLELSGTSFLRREPPEDPVSFVQRSAQAPITRHRAVVLFHAPLSVVSDRLLAEAGTLEAVDADSCRFVSAPDSWEWLAITLAMVGVAYSIEGPPELIDRSRELAGRIARAADGQPGAGEGQAAEA